MTITNILLIIVVIGVAGYIIYYSIKKKQRIKIKRGIEVQMIKNAKALAGVHTHG